MRPSHRAVGTTRILAGIIRVTVSIAINWAVAQIERASQPTFFLDNSTQKNKCEQNSTNRKVFRPMSFICFVILTALAACTAIGASVSERPSDRQLRDAFFGGVGEIRQKKRSTSGLLQLGDVELMPCIGLGLFCVNLTVPLTHSDPDGEKISVAFIVRPSLRPQQRYGRKAFVFIAGGPGTVVHSIMPFLLTAYGGLGVMKTHDFIVMEQRGIGWSCGLGCPQSLASMYLGQSLSSRSVDQFAAATEKYAEDCIAEIANDPFQQLFSDTCIVGSPLSPSQQRAKVARHIGTREAIRDLQAFLSSCKFSKVALSGVSYGAMFQQAFAATFPEKVELLVVDSGSNTIVSPQEYNSNYRLGRQALWARLGTLCAEHPQCRLDLCDSVDPDQRDSCLDSGATAARMFFTGALRVFDPLQEQRAVDLPFVAIDPLTFEPVQGVARKAFHSLPAHTSNVVQSHLKGRAALVRRVLSAIRGDLLPLVRGLYSNFGVTIDPRTDSINRFLFTKALNGAAAADLIIGGDYLFRDSPGRSTVREMAAQHLRSLGKHIDSFAGVAGPGYLTSAMAFADLDGPAYSASAQNESALASPGWHSYPIFILQSSIDAQIPQTFGAQLFDKYSATGPTFRVMIKDAGHGVVGAEAYYGWLESGIRCANDAIDRMLMGDLTAASADRTVACEVVQKLPGYLPLAPVTVATAADAAKFTLLEWLSLPELIFGTHFAAGCTNGGNVAWMQLNKTATAAWFSACSFFPGWHVDASAIVLRRSQVEIRERGFAEMQARVSSGSTEVAITVVKDPVAGKLMAV